ncbi:hypothetical protein VNI00_006473 [Paramarasmius palmivorus]|uniref:BTB domain-containing protein n=1 Tax=Paramarasmius palmivorus TaxID=297713 RepID=A0AAW0D4W0_9AGAR
MFPKFEGCSTPCDITILSSDGKHLSAHKRHLEIFSESFPNADWDNLTTHEPVSLVENGVVLGLLLQFMHNAPVPDLSSEDLKADDLVDLCKAAEKYGNFFALDACRREIRSRAKRIEPIDALKIFVRLHEPPCATFPEMDDIVRRTICLKHNVVLPHFRRNTELYYFWSQYRSTCQEAKLRIQRELEAKVANMEFIHTEAILDIHGGYDCSNGHCKGGEEYARRMLSVLQRMSEYITLEDLDEAVRMAPAFGIQWGCEEKMDGVSDGLSRV